MTLAEQFAEFTTSLAWETLPVAVQRQARLCLLDMLGATLAGAATATSTIGAQLARQYASADGAQLIGQPARASVPLAALANGMTCHALELDDGHRYAIGLHNGATTLPAALAVAEDEDRCLGDLLAATVAGYEIASRIGTAINPEHRRRGFHATGTVGVFGAAAASGYLRGHSREHLARALGIAGSAAGGVFEFLRDGSTSKHFHAGHAALAGVLAADLAAAGLTGPLSILEGREGFLRVYSSVADPSGLVEGLGERYAFLDVYFKLHAACAHIFAPIDATLELRARAGDQGQVEQVEVATYHAAAILNERAPRTAAAAKFSIPYCVAAAWHRGEVGMDCFTPAALHDPIVGALAQRVEVREDPALEACFPAVRAARVRIRLRDGRQLEAQVDVPRGMPERPATADELARKFLSLAAPCIGLMQAEQLRQMVLEAAPGLPVRELLALTVPDAAVATGAGAPPPSVRGKARGNLSARVAGGQGESQCWGELS